jgi:alanine dehydrogenase
MAETLIDFDLIRLKISLRDENLSHDYQKLGASKIIFTYYALLYSDSKMTTLKEDI